MITRETAYRIACAHDEIATSEALLAEISKALSRHEAPDIRDSFGRPQGNLQLGIPNGENGRRLYNVQWSLARPVIEAHIGQQKAILSALNEQARVELDGAA